MQTLANVPTLFSAQTDRQEPPERAMDNLRPVTREPVHFPVPDSPTKRMRRPDDNQRGVPTVIVDKSCLFRAGLIHTLVKTRFRVVADCASLSELPVKALNSKPALLLISMDGDTASLAQVLLLQEAHPALQIVMLSEQFCLEEALNALRSGRHSYIMKDEINPEIVLKSLELTLLGAAVVVSRGFVDVIANDRTDVTEETVAPEDRQPEDRREDVVEYAAPVAAERPQRAAGLSGRERLILSHLMQGAANKHIARELGIAEATVKVHVKSLLRKVRVHNRTQAAMWGINNLGSASAERDDERLSG
jgi:DNA-binding NarL/FixJ family response regulator